METGQYLMITNSFKNLQKTTSRLSIQLGLNGFSFFISSQKLNSDAYSIILEGRKSEKEILEILFDFIIKNEVLQQNFSQVTVTYSDYIFAVVPKAMFEEKHIAEYLKFNVKHLESDNLFYNTVYSNKIVFSIPEIIKRQLENYYTISSYNHLSSILLKYISKEYKQNIGHRIFIYTYKGFFYLMILNGQDLLFCNTFPYESTGDFLYYLLFTFEQLNLDPTKETLHLLNTMDKETISALEPYIYDIKIPTDSLKNIVHLANLQS